MLTRREAVAWTRWRKRHELTWDRAAARYGVGRRHLTYVVLGQRASARLERLIRADLQSPTFRDRIAQFLDHPFWRNDE